MSHELQVLNVIGTRSEVVKKLLRNIRDSFGQSIVHHRSQIWAQGNVAIEERGILKQVVINITSRQIVTYGDNEFCGTEIRIDKWNQLEADKFKKISTFIGRHKVCVIIKTIVITTIALHNSHDQGFRHIFPVAKVIYVSCHRLKKIIGV